MKLKHCPETEPLMQIAWRDCLLWACVFDPIVKRFREETGNTWEPSRNPIDSMVDDACGAKDAYCAEFVEWFNANVWGDSKAPLDE